MGEVYEFFGSLRVNRQVIHSDNSPKYDVMVDADLYMIDRDKNDGLIMVNFNTEDGGLGWDASTKLTDTPIRYKNGWHIEPYQLKSLLKDSRTSNVKIFRVLDSIKDFITEEAYIEGDRLNLVNKIKLITVKY